MVKIQSDCQHFLGLLKRQTIKTQQTSTQTNGGLTNMEIKTASTTGYVEIAQVGGLVKKWGYELDNIGYDNTPLYLVQFSDLQPQKARCGFLVHNHKHMGLCSANSSIKSHCKTTNVCKTMPFAPSSSHHHK